MPGENERKSSAPAEKMIDMDMPTDRPDDALSEHPLRERVQKGVMGCIDAPFQRGVESMLATLRDLNPNAQEATILESSTRRKWVPALRNSALQAALASPGILLSDPEKVQFFLLVISSITGFAWFSVSLKEVKKKFTEYGIELTEDLLEACLTAILIFAVISGYGIGSEVLDHVQNLIESAGFNIHAFIESPVFRTSAICASLAVGVRMIGNLIKATIKFDANDALLTGTSDIARRFFETSLSSLRSTAQTLSSQHDLQAANYQIILAIQSFNDYLQKIGYPSKNLLKDESLKQLVSMPQADFDQKMIPVTRANLDLFREYVDISGDPELQGRMRRSFESLDTLSESYREGEIHVSQDFSDQVYAESFKIIADFLEMYQDLLEQKR